MTYYILPKNNINFDFYVKETLKEIEPYISYSFYHYNNIIKNELSKVKKDEYDYISMLINPYEFLMTKVPGNKNAIYKFENEIESIFYFELYEVIRETNVVSFFTINRKLNISCFTKNKLCCHKLMELLRGYIIYNDEIKLYNCNYNYVDLKSINTKNDILIFELTTYNVKDVFLILYCILKQQKQNGISIIKTTILLFRPIIEMLYIISSFFDKVELCKPIISNITKDDIFIVCINFNEYNKMKLLKCIEHYIEYNETNENNRYNRYNGNNGYNETNETNENNRYNGNNGYNEKNGNNGYNEKNRYNKNIVSIISNNIPLLFLSKIEEFNAIIGQQYLETNNQLLNYIWNIKNNNKLDTLKRNNIQKCIQWCEKNNFEYNTILEWSNMFIKEEEIIYNVLENIIEKIVC
jgi:hypothetical protein